MPPKKGDKKEADKGKDEKKAGTFTEVEKTFLELQLADCNRKNARLLQALTEHELKNEELQRAYDTLDEDRSDIIAFLKKQLNNKIEENQELKEKVKGLEELREIETQEFKSQNSELEKNFKIMKEQLTSENKLLAGKLNTLEEFRAIKDDLMQKFENQEQAYNEQEMKYKRLLYESEKKFVIGKDKLKKEMEARLLQLAQDFQDATELRIAASTHRVIRENIAINNELDNILQTQAKLAEMNKKFKENEKAAQIAKELAEEEKDKAINKSVVQVKIIDQLTKAFQEVKQERILFEKRNYDFQTLQIKIQKITKENENLSLQVRILEQNLHAMLTDQNKSQAEFTKMSKENEKYKRVLEETATAVQAALKLDQWAAADPAREVLDRQVLLARLLDIVTEYRDMRYATSIDSLQSFTKIYEEGDLGFVPKPAEKKKLGTPYALQRPNEPLPRLEAKSTTPTMVSSEPSQGSLKTIPSLKQILPAAEEQLTGTEKESLESFTKSHKSESSESVGDQEEIIDIEEQLAKSKLEVQKSIMKDLAASMLSVRSRPKLDVFAREKKESVIEEKENEEEIELQLKEEEKVVHFPDEDLATDSGDQGGHAEEHLKTERIDSVQEDIGEKEEED